MVKRAGVGLHMGITPRSSQRDLKVIFQVKSAKKGEDSKFFVVFASIVLIQDVYNGWNPLRPQHRGTPNTS